MENLIWGIDPGSSTCGIVRLDSGLIGICLECEPIKVYKRIISLSGASDITIVIEDIFPYSMRLTPAVIDTCKLIGELTYRFNTDPQVTSVHLVARNTIKNWIFKTFPDVAIPRINKKLWLKHNRDTKKGKKGLVKLDGKMREPSFNYVDDRIVCAAMKELFKMETPKPGKPNVHGLTQNSHAWQALAVCSFYFHSH